MTASRRRYPVRDPNRSDGAVSAGAPSHADRVILYDAFIPYASEDEKELARPLAHATCAGTPPFTAQVADFADLLGGPKPAADL